MKEERKPTFAQAFMRIYDRKIAAGETTFGGSGIKKDDFTRICTDSSYVMPRERLELVCSRMKLTEDERKLLLSYAEEL